MASKKLFAHPDGVSREYTRTLLRYARELQQVANETFIADLPALVAQYEQDMRSDSYTTELERTTRTYEIATNPSEYVVTSKLPPTYAALSAFNDKEFRGVFKANTGMTLPPTAPPGSSAALLGVNVFRAEPYLKPLAENWISSNAALIKDMETQYKKDIVGVIQRGVMNGQSVKDMTKAIRGTEKVDGYSTVNMKLDYRAKLIAQDQINKGNAALTRERLSSVGVSEYIWRNVGDNRVRPDHTHEGYAGNEYSFVGKGDHPAPDGDPGTPVRCRCRAEAIWPEEVASTPPADTVKREQTRKDIIWGAADDAWKILGNTTDRFVLAQMRKMVSTSLQNRGIAKATANAQLNSWMNDRLGLTPKKRAKVPPAVVTPPAPPAKAPPAVTTPPKVDPFAPAPHVPIVSGNISGDTVAWHQSSFAGAPAAVRKTIYDANQHCNVTYVTKKANGGKQGAFCRYWAHEINMAEYTAGATKHGDAVWRHEFGHYLDGYWAQEWNFANRSKAGYKSVAYLTDTSEWKTARRKDRAKLLANDARVNEASAAYSAQETAMHNAGDFLEREDWMKQHYSSLGLDYKAMQALVREETFIFRDGSNITTQTKMLRLANALEYGRAEKFLQVLQDGAASAVNGHKTVGMMSDLIGAVTKELLGGYRTGFGHGKAYYAKTSTAAGTEAMANLLSLHGTNTAKAWSQALDKLTPSLNAEMKKVLGYANN
jgi:SPP1 gp7 family putative phage head morphogenesis protein